jgi:hypothetical protein
MGKSTTKLPMFHSSVSLPESAFGGSEALTCLQAEILKVCLSMGYYPSFPIHWGKTIDNNHCGLSWFKMVHPAFRKSL